MPIRDSSHRPVHLALLILLFATTLPAAAGTVVVVDENNLNWGFVSEAGTPTFGFVTGPATPPDGTGSAAFNITSGADGVLLGTLNHAGLRLVDLTGLGYCTYQNTSPQAVALQFNVDYDDTDTTTSWQGRLVYEPYYTQVVLANTWQCWDALTQAPPLTVPPGRRYQPQGTGNWWSSGTPVVGDSSQAAVCTIGAPCHFSEILTLYPNIAVHQGALGGTLVKAGSGWPAPFDFSVDSLTIDTQATGVTYDFETNPIPVELTSFEVE